VSTLKSNGFLLVMVAVSTLALGITLASPPPVGHGSEVTVSVTVNSKISATFSAEGVYVRSNTAWRMEVVPPSGAQPTIIHGGPTAGDFVPLPTGSSVLSLVSDG